MSILKKSQIRELSPQERKEKLKLLRQQLSRERGLISSGASPENSGGIKGIKRTIARILTQENIKAASSLSEGNKEMKIPVKEKPLEVPTTPSTSSKDSPPPKPIKDEQKGVIEKDD
jgi:large subunit ribosomal protein L29